MNRLKSLALGLAVVGLIAGLYVWNVRQVEAQPTLVAVAAATTDVYAVKFLCGELAANPDRREGPVKPGNYATAINIHNPNPRDVKFRKKAVLLFDPTNPPLPEEPKPPGPEFNATLLPNWGLDIDCNDIRTVLLAGIAPPGTDVFIKGWVVIRVPTLAPLDVVVAYTAHGIDANFAPVGFSLQVLPVEPKNVTD